MKIEIRGGEENMTLLLPTGIIFSRGTAWLADTVGRKYAGDAMKDIPPEALKNLFAEIRRIKRRYGKWELVDVESADGEKVKITL